MNGKKVIEKLNLLEDVIMVVMFMTMVVTIFLQIVMRYVFNDSLVWSEELGKFIFVWLSWVGISIGQRNKEHIKITLVTDKLPAKISKWCEIIADGILLTILGVTIYYGVDLIISQQMTTYTGIKISVSWGYLALALGCAIMFLRVLAEIYHDIKWILNGKGAETKDMVDADGRS